MKTTAVIEVRFGRLASEAVEGIAEALMAALDTHPDAVGPMVVGDRSKGEVTLSFEFAAVGDINHDIARAFEILGEAVPPAVGTGQDEGSIDVLGAVEGWPSGSPREVDLVYA